MSGFITDQNVTTKTAEIFKDLIRTNNKISWNNLIRNTIWKNWNATRFMEDDRKTARQALQTLWADKNFVDFDLKTDPTVDLSKRILPPGPLHFHWRIFKVFKVFGLLKGEYQIIQAVSQ